MKLTISIPDLAKLKQFDGWQAVLQRYLFNATHDNIDDLEVTAQGYMYSTFQNPQGPLENNFTQDTRVSGKTVKGYLSNKSPYAWRRDQGFSNRTDKLGRFYKDDPGISFMATTLSLRQDNIIQVYTQAVSDALAELTASSGGGEGDA